MSIFQIKPWMAVTCAAALACCPAIAGSVSSMSVYGRLSDSSGPGPVVAGVGSTVEVVAEPSWFGASGCRLYVDDELVAESTGGAVVHGLPGTADPYRSYKVTLVAGDTEVTKFVTVFPDSIHRCSMHSLYLNRNFLDSRPAGTVRRWEIRQERDIAWSASWNGSACQALVNLYPGRDTQGVSPRTLVDQQGPGEGLYPLVPSEERLSAGIYALTHFDGVETLTAYIKVPCATRIIIK